MMAIAQRGFANSVVRVATRRSQARSARDPRASTGRWRRLRPTVPDLLLPSALALWAIGTRGANAGAVDQYGLLPALPFAYFAAFAVLIVSIGWLLARRELSAPRLALHLATLVFMIHATAPFIYAEPRFSWSYKHFGVVNYISSHGRLNAAVDVYHNWPGFFALAAWFGRIAGLVDPLAYAAWAQLFFNLLACLEMGFALRALPLTDRERWLALFLFATGNWVAQDYFSPQAMGFVLGLGVLAIAIHWLGGYRAPRWVRLMASGIRDLLMRPREGVLDRPPPTVELRRVSAIAAVLGAGIVVVFALGLSPYGVAIQALGFVVGLGVLAVVLHWLGYYRPPRWPGMASLRINAMLARDERVLDQVSQAVEVPSIGAIVAVLGVYFVIVFTHELSPYVLAIQFTALAVVGRIRPRWVVLAMWALCLAYLLPRFAVVDDTHHIVAALTNPFRNLLRSAKGLPPGLPGRQLAANAARALAFSMWVLGLLGAARRVWERRQVLPMLALAFSPLLIVFAHSYGGEAVYRAYLFSLPWTACLVASILRPGPRPEHTSSQRLTWLTPPVALLTTLALLFPALFGLDMQNVMPPAEVRASSYFYQHAEPGSVLLSSPYFPTRLAANYDEFVINDNGSDPNFLDVDMWGRILGADDLPMLEDKIASYGATTGYLVLSTSQSKAARLYGILPEGSFASLEQALLNSPNWSVFYRNSDTIIFQLMDPPRPLGKDQIRRP
jgi:hypothetical protein